MKKTELSALISLLLEAQTPPKDIELYGAFFKKLLPKNETSKAYSRLLLHADERGEVLLMRWTLGRRCSPHDHGASKGYVIFLDGTFSENSYQWTEDTLVLSQSIMASAPASMPFEKERIHDMKCEKDGLTLHVYQPSIDGMKVYDIEGRKTYVVDNTCGAWIPELTQTLSVEEWL